MKYSDLKFDWQSEVTASMGYGLQARRMLKPLIDGGANIKLLPDESYLPPFMKINDPYWNNLIEDSKKKPDNSIRICYAIPPRYATNPNAFNVGYSMWETTQYPREWAQIINSKCNMFFAGCEALVDSAKQAGIVKPIVPMNASIDCSLWDPNGPITNVSEFDNIAVKFLFIGNFIARKNLQDLITGFNYAFNGVKDVALLIKTWSSDDSGPAKKHITDAIRFMSSKTTGIDKPKISVITDVLEESEIMGLIRGSDAYVTVSYGEGFDLPMMQAMALEKLIVSNQFLAHGDYLTTDNALIVNHSLTPCTDAAAPLYDSYQMWARPSMDSYIEALRQAYELVKSGQSKPYGKAARKTILQKYDINTNSDKLANVIRDIQNNKYAPTETNSKILIKELVQ